MTSWLALGGWLIGSGLLVDSGWLAGWLLLADSGWLWLADWLARFGWLIDSLWLVDWLTARPPTYMPASRLTSCLLITSQTLWVHLVYGVKLWGFNRCHSKYLRNKNRLETCKNPRPTSARGEFPIMHNINYEFPHGVFFINSTNNASLKLSCKFGESKCNSY